MWIDRDRGRHDLARDDMVAVSDAAYESLLRGRITNDMKQRFYKNQPSARSSGR